MRTARLTLLLAILALSVSCRVMHHQYDGAKEITPGTVLTKPSETIGTIEGSKKAMFVLFGWIPVRDASGPDLAEELARESEERVERNTLSRSTSTPFKNAAKPSS